MSDAYRVLKFGGSSLGAPDRIARTMQLIASEREHSRIAVVCSAMGDTTDLLLKAIEHAVDGRSEDAKMVALALESLAIQNAEGAYQELKKIKPTMASMPDFRALVAPRSEKLRRILYGISLIREGSPRTVDLILSFGERISNS